MKTLIALIIALTVFMSVPVFAGDHEEAEHTNESHEENGSLESTIAQIKQAGLETEVIRFRQRSQVISAPGSVAFNAYKLADITTLVDGAIHTRHVHLDEDVKKGQELVTLTSSALAQAEAEYLRAEAEHSKSKLELKRVEGLVNEKIVSQARLQQTQSTYQAAHANLTASKATLFAYGMNKRGINNLIKATQYGQLTLYAPSSGTIVADDFRIGQHIAAGTRLMQIVDESTVWIEVKLSQAQMSGIKIGHSAVVSTKNSKTKHEGKVINIHHRLDQTTRTIGVRLEVQNPEDALHPGMFVQAEIEAGSDEEALLLPVQAIQRYEGDKIIFIEEKPGHYELREVRVGKTRMGLVPILEGLKEGESVVVKGAFALTSELAKSGFDAD
ncbi:membrane fusion protein, cobalt-zinc-cadmium efflux system [Mariprofundus micogutta]|uniref:Membrane fusion protein, cobalt-zinc-cadmium efflux system n=1 Tax=Mariprofundus micogutta TaxID=1921010 RepID=A0A1L8CP05_9PROT|nr:efflux RND transporter periplasmic adaptor subunit [Mariprofundus micogutta]GAV20655.1 membrane fusion protein, cobalt-zinc-cadmium efflux system [Mariprofundus micogutta]